MLQKGETTGPVGLYDAAGHQLDASKTLSKLLGDMREAAIGRNFGRYQRLSDELEVLASAYMRPGVIDEFAGFRLSPSERIISELLFSKRGEIVSKDAIMSALYFNKPEEAQVKIVDVFICRLRKRLAEKFTIQNVPCYGYRMIMKPDANRMAA